MLPADDNAGVPGRRVSIRNGWFIDETWIKTNMAPLRGWGPCGKRLRGFAPHGHWRTLTFLGALQRFCQNLKRSSVCIVGGGLAGLTAALELARAAFR